MKFVKFATQEQAEGYRARLQAHHDQVQEGPKIIILPALLTYDGYFALTLLDDAYPATDGEIVNTVEPPAEETEL